MPLELKRVYPRRGTAGWSRSKQGKDGPGVTRPWVPPVLPPNGHRTWDKQLLESVSSSGRGGSWENRPLSPVLVLQDHSSRCDFSVCPLCEYLQWNVKSNDIHCVRKLRLFNPPKLNNGFRGSQTGLIFAASKPRGQS